MTETAQNIQGLPTGATIFDKPPHKIVIERVTYQGRQVVNARTWYFDVDGAVWRPTKRGLQLPLDLAGQVARAMLLAAGNGKGA